jgi:CBS domain-containing protein
MKVRDAMAKTVATASPVDSIHHVAQLMKAEDTGSL